MKFKERIKQAVKNLCERTPEDLDILQYRNMMKRMANINLRTHRSYTHIGRNDPCICGSGQKFKVCCIHKYVGLRPGEKTPALTDKQKKENAYFKKHRRIPK